MKVIIVTSVLSLAVLGCATSKPVSLSEEPRRLVGTENGVRIDAEVQGETLTRSSTIPFKYQITNERRSPIAVADLIPDASYDEETGVVTVGLGSEVPGERFLPRLVRIGSGEKKEFSTVAHVQLLSPFGTAPFRRRPASLQIRLSFLGETAPFERLIGISERAVEDPRLAAEIFPKWVELTEIVLTNAVPMRFDGQEPAAPADGRRRRGNSPL